MLVAQIYRILGEFETAIHIYNRLIRLPLFALDKRYFFHLNVDLWGLLLETNNPDADICFEVIKKSPVLQEEVAGLIHEAYNTQWRINVREGRLVRIDTQAMENALLTHDLSQDMVGSLTYALIHYMKGKKKLATKWAEKSQEIHKKEAGVETVTVFGLKVLAFMAHTEYERGSLAKSKEYAKRALVVAFQVQEKPPLHQGNMYDILSNIHARQGDENMAIKFQKKARKLLQ